MAVRDRKTLTALMEFEKNPGEFMRQAADAADVVHLFMLAHYQALLEHGLTSAVGTPWKVEIHRSGHWVSSSFRGCEVLEKDPRETLRKVRLLHPVLIEGKKKISHRACCPLAEHRNCVCTESFSCPVHGQACHGTHD